MYERAAFELFVPKPTPAPRVESSPPVKQRTAANSDCRLESLLLPSLPKATEVADVTLEGEVEAVTVQAPDTDADNFWKLPLMSAHTAMPFDAIVIWPDRV